MSAAVLATAASTLPPFQPLPSSLAPTCTGGHEASSVGLPLTSPDHRRRSDEMKETEPSPLVRSQAQGASFKLPPILTSSSQV